VTNPSVITPLETRAIVLAKPSRNVRVAVFVAIVYIGRAMVLIILAGSHHAVLKTAPLRIIEFRWWGVPSASFAVSWRRWSRLRRVLRENCTAGT
jgi:hypothetical protein